MSNVVKKSSEEDLQEFRRKWQNELSQLQIEQLIEDEERQTSQQRLLQQQSVSLDVDETNSFLNSEASAADFVETKDGYSKAESQRLWKEASELERNGKVDEAVFMYRKAFRLNPDLNEKDSSVTTPSVFRADLSGFPRNFAPQEQHPSLDEEEHEIIEKMKQLSISSPQEPHKDATSTGESDRIGEKQSSVIPRGSDLAFLQEFAIKWSHDDSVSCDPEREVSESTFHISRLPPELLCHIFGFLLAVDLESVSQVNRLWFLISRRSEVWFSFCQRDLPEMVKKIQKQAFEKEVALIHWRALYINHPRPRYDGIYISRNSYIRQGQTEGSYYQPAHQVTYFRYFRFYEGGFVMSLLSFDLPKQVSSILSLPLEEVPLSRSNLMIKVGSFAPQEELEQAKEFLDDQTAKSDGKARSDQKRSRSGNFLLKLCDHNIPWSQRQLSGSYPPPDLWSCFEIDITSRSGGWMNQINVMRYYTTSHQYDPYYFSVGDISKFSFVKFPQSTLRNRSIKN